MTCRNVVGGQDLNLRPLGYERRCLDVCGHLPTAVERRLRRSTTLAIAERPDASGIVHAEGVDQRLTSPGDATAAVSHNPNSSKAAACHSPATDGSSIVVRSYVKGPTRAR